MLRKIFLIAKFTLLLTLLLLLTGCGDKYEAVNPLSDEEAIAYVCNEIQKEFGDEVTATITSKTDLRICTAWFDGPVAYADVKNGHAFEFEVRGKDGTVAFAQYSDGYKNPNNSGDDRNPTFWHTYESPGIFGVMQTELEAELKEQFLNYRIYRSLPDTKTCRYNIFVVSSDADTVAKAISRFKEILSARKEKYASYFNLYIYKDVTAFRAVDFRKLEYTPIGDFGEDTIRQSTDGTVTRGSLCSGFQADFFTSDGARLADAQVVDVDLSGCNSIVFWYHWNTRQARYIGETRIYGISKQP